MGDRKWLTSEQRIRVSSYANRWGKVGLKPGPCDRGEAERWFCEVCRAFGVESPERMVWINSPAEAQAVQASISPPAPVPRITCRDLIGPTLSQVEEEFNVRDTHGVWNTIWNSMVGTRNAVGYPMIGRVRDQTGGPGAGDFCSESLGRMFGVLGVLGFVEFYFLECGVGEWERLRPVVNFVENGGWWSPRQHEVVLFERPVEIHLSGGRLHRDGGPAIRYRDGWKVWYLNGVRVPREIAEMPADQLDPVAALKEEDAAVRQTTIRKIGIERIRENRERILEGLRCEVLDSWMGYELLMLDLGGEVHGPYLKMVNPSTGASHLEGAHPDCNTVKKALKWRNGRSGLPVKIT